MCSEEGNQAAAKRTFDFTRAYSGKIGEPQSGVFGGAEGFSSMMMIKHNDAAQYQIASQRLRKEQI